MKYVEIVPKLLELFPEARDDYEELRELFGDDLPGAYNVMDEVWEKLIAEADEEQLARAFAFIETLFRSEEREVRFVAAEYSWRQLAGTPLLAKSRPFFGERTRKHVADCEAECLRARNGGSASPRTTSGRRGSSQP